MSKNICITGLGGGGCRILDLLDDNASLPRIAIDSDSRSLGESHAPTRVNINNDETGGLGTGGDCALGQKLAENDGAVIEGLFLDMDMVVLVTCLGGGTGTGAVSTVLKAASGSDALTLCLAVLPFDLEGESRKKEALNALSDIGKWADVILVVPNDRLAVYVDDNRMATVFDEANKLLAKSIKGVVRLLTTPSYLNLDFQSLRNTMRHGGGSCTLAFGSAQGYNKAHDAVSRLLESPLTENGNLLKDAKSVLVSIGSGRDLTLSDVGVIMDSITARLDKNCHIAMGTIVDDALEGVIAITCLLSEKWDNSGLEKSAGLDSFVENALPKAQSGKGRKKSKDLQSKLSLDVSGRGRFKDVEPTIMDGQDLDIPTFIRRSIHLEE